MIFNFDNKYHQCFPQRAILAFYQNILMHFVRIHRIVCFSHLMLINFVSGLLNVCFLCFKTWQSNSNSHGQKIYVFVLVGVLFYFMKIKK